jgi:FMN reductase [NAD(P)H]
VEFQALLPKRRMVRNYAPERVSRESIERIVATVRRAPSAGYSQGQRLLVVTTEEGRARIVKVFEDFGWTRERELEPWLESAPVLVLVCTREDDYHDRYRMEDKLVEGAEIEWPVPYWYVDAGAALMMLLLAAIDEGLAAGVSGVPLDVAAALRSQFGIPADLTVVALVTIGRAAPDPGWSAVTSRRTQSRRDPDSVVRWETWN